MGGYSEPLRYSYERTQTAAGQHSFDKDGLDALDHRLEAQLGRDAALLEGRGYGVTTLLHEGEPVEEIVAAAQALGVDAVAMTTHGYTGIGQLIFGSVAQAVLVRVSVPVILLCAEDDQVG